MELNDCWRWYQAIYVLMQALKDQKLENHKTAPWNFLIGNWKITSLKLFKRLKHF